MQTIYALLALLLAMLLSQELMQTQMHMLRQNVRREQTEIATALAMRLHELIGTRQTGAPGITPATEACDLLGGQNPCPEKDDFAGQRAVVPFLLNRQDTLYFDVAVHVDCVAPSGQSWQPSPACGWKRVRVAVGLPGQDNTGLVQFDRVYPVTIIE